MRTAMVYKAFARWRQFAKEIRGQRRLMQRGALRMKGAGMFAALARWREYIQEKKTMVAKSMWVMRRWAKQSALRCLGAWSQYSKAEVQQRQVMQKTVGRMLHRSISFAMDLWQKKVQEFQRDKSEEERRQKIMARIVKRMLNQTKAVAIVRWSASVCERVRKRGSVERVLRRTINTKISAGV
jgi:protein SFI1